MKTAEYPHKERKRKNMERNENGLGLNTAPTRDMGTGDGCGCAMTCGRQLAMVYAPSQCFRLLYEPDKALMTGTLFEELYKPLGEELL